MIRLSNNQPIQYNSSSMNNMIMFNVGGNDTPTIVLKADGTVEFDPKYPLNEIAKFFWETMAYSNPLRSELERLKTENKELRERLASRYATVLHSIDMPVSRPTVVRVEYDGLELRAKTDETTWHTVRVGF